MRKFSRDYRFKYTTQEKRSGYKVIMVLTIHNVNRSDIGTYSCVASNTMGKSDASVRIYGKEGETSSGRKNSICFLTVMTF
jgi:neurotrimin